MNNRDYLACDPCKECQAKLALFDRMREALRELSHTPVPIEFIGRTEEALQLLVEADALAEKDKVWEAAYEGYKQEHWNAP